MEELFADSFGEMFERRRQMRVVESQLGEDFLNRIARDLRIDRPNQNFEIFAPHLEQIENSVENHLMRCNRALQQAELIRVEFRTEAFAFEMLQPAGA